MNKRYLILFAFLLVLFFSFKPVKYAVLDFFNFAKESFSGFLKKTESTITKYQNQALQIEKLQKENNSLKKKIVYFESFYANCKDLKKIKDSNFTLVKAVSYANLPDFSKIYVNFTSNTYPLGLVYNNLAAGILVKKVGHYSLGLLNSNKKTSYTVLIGKEEIPGIFYGEKNIIKYIPKFKKINIGDLVITSGLDGIFYKGAKVGIITSVKEKKLYQEAKVKLFYNSLAPNYFYVIQKNDTIIKKGGENGFTKH